MKGLMNTDEGYDFFEYYYPKPVEKVSDWKLTLEFWSDFLKSFEARKMNFPIAEIFIKNEIDRIDREAEKSKFKELNNGFIDFEKGENKATLKVEFSFFAYKVFFHYDIEHKEIIITKNNGERIAVDEIRRIPKGDMFFYLVFYAKGYATAKYYYYLKSLLSSQTIQQMPISQIEFDLKKYDLTTTNNCPYFPEPKFDGNEYHIYEGATGNNRFQYFKVSKKSNAGKQCKQFVEKYYTENTQRHTYYEDGQKLIDACKNDAIEYFNGLDAYLKYWNDCLTENDKLSNNIYSIQHFEALKEWFNLSIEKHIKKNEALYLNDEDVKNADVEQYKENIAESVATFLKQSERIGERKFSGISKVQANELIKFYYWIKGDSEKEINKPEIKIEQLTPKSKRTRDFIENEFEKLKDSCFHSNDEYNVFLELLTNFFEGNFYKIPVNTIKLKRGSKTKIATVFNPIHKALIMSDRKLKSDTEYFQIIKVLNYFSDKTNAEIYKAITR